MLEWLAFFSVNLLGAVSPGSDFAIVVHYGLKGSRRNALLATLGIGAALVVHILYCIFGIAWLLQNYPRIFFCVHLLGSGYLAYLGFKMFRSPQLKPEKVSGTSSKQAFFAGFLTNLLNPKAALFLLSLFSQFISPEMSLGMKTVYAITVPVVAICWFSFLSFAITHSAFLPYLQRHQRIFSKCMGILLISISFSILYSLL